MRATSACAARRTQFEPASLAAQVGMMLYSHTFEVAAQKTHYFAAPFALVLIRFGEDRRAD